ncbi:uncharacterized protein CIMG_11387 [Coccidioides immitis RS]|uniref:Uncharacterized protein n=1 Tax=Coccidioides immitis (strain RS) TaxID=246410 RepID=A0A0D8JXN1_COCIM|nr:uncharacterized protein CIMG_11387 [Coccidioides immitis RS]KJF61033.1 hypothetical protein CIMG_11387 [Coccidioides immitis RS]
MALEAAEGSQPLRIVLLQLGIEGHHRHELKPRTPVKNVVDLGEGNPSHKHFDSVLQYMYEQALWDRGRMKFIEFHAIWNNPNNGIAPALMCKPTKRKAGRRIGLSNPVEGGYAGIFKSLFNQNKTLRAP